MSTSPISTADILELSLDKIGERFAPLRIVNPAADSAMLQSVERYGQIMPVVVCEAQQNDYQLLDGFKRLRSARRLGMKSLKAQVMRLTLRAGKAALVQLNWVGKSISNMEEALVVHSLFHEDSLSQVEIATLLGRHKSWVCRRISLIDRLCDEGLAQIKLGLLPISMSRELIKLPRGNQELLIQAIANHHLSCRDTGRLVEELQGRPEYEHRPILERPWEILQYQDHLDTTASRLFSPAVRSIHHKILLMERYCLAVSCTMQTTEIKQFEEKEELFIRACCGEAVRTLEHTVKEVGRVAVPDAEAGQ
nr:ParB N-terminal domain-containing protein [uncultured Desulfobulbus sp.]